MFTRFFSFVRLPADYISFLARSMPKEHIVFCIIPKAVIMYCYIAYVFGPCK